VDRAQVAPPELRVLAGMISPIACALYITYGFIINLSGEIRAQSGV